MAGSPCPGEVIAKADSVLGTKIQVSKCAQCINAIGHFCDCKIDAEKEQILVVTW